jgi:hypothetical protein
VFIDWPNNNKIILQHFHPIHFSHLRPVQSIQQLKLFKMEGCYDLLYILKATVAITCPPCSTMLHPLPLLPPPHVEIALPWGEGAPECRANETPPHGEDWRSIEAAVKAEARFTESRPGFTIG